MKHKDQESHSGGRSFTANNDYAVTEYHTVVLKTSTDHAVAESQSRKPKKRHVVVKYPTVEAREHLPRTNGHAVAQYYVVGWRCQESVRGVVNYHKVTPEKQLSAKDSGEQKIHKNRQKPKQRSAKISTRTHGGCDCTATAMLIRAQHVKTRRRSDIMRSEASAGDKGEVQTEPELQHSADKR